MKISNRIISFKDVSAKYSNEYVIENINLDIYEKDFIAILGPNGGGKTTLIKALLGLIPYEGGIIKKDNLRLGYVPQYETFDKDFPITVIETVLTGSISKKINIFHKYSKSDSEKATKLLKKFDMINFKNTQIGELSGGQLQKVLICRALMSDCDVLILDEPTASLDVEVKNNTYKLLKELNEKITILVISHDIGALSSHVKSFVCLNKKLHCSHKHLNNNTLKELYGDHVNFIEHKH